MMNDTTKNIGSKGTNVQVAVRCRPVNSEERKTGQPSVVTCDAENKSISVSYGPSGKKTTKNFTFDKVFGMYSRQDEVFDAIVRPIVDEVLEGFNCTIFAYGQTGTGKTHTMEGNIHSDEDAGIVPRSVKTILENLESSGSEFTIRVSFLELYNEELQDLLNISGEKKLKLCEDVKKGVVCQNLEEITVLNVSDIFDILQRGIQQRQTAATLCNKNSSRSHSIFTMKIMIKECNVEGEEVIRHGQLNLVDLAGSECVGRSGAVNDRAREAGSINQSLLTLGRVITALVDHHGHIPYRDSKLTRLLQESLGGKAKTCIIATFSPSQLAVEETLSTLDYAYRAKSIKNQPTVNQKLTKKVIMKEYLAEVEQLKIQLMQTREKNGVYLDPAEYYALETRLASQESQLQECESALAIRNEEVKIIRKERDELSNSFEQVKQDYEQSIVLLDSAKEELNKTKSEVNIAYVEIQACNAVVNEQGCTESALQKQGETIKKDLIACQGDVSKLLAKVDILNQSELEKFQYTQNFVKNLNVTSSELANQVLALENESQVHSKVLQSGVTEMLYHGKETCETLKSAINQALSVMIGDAEQARDTMVQSCTDLNVHLLDTSNRIASTLKSLQAQLSDWLGEVDTCMSQAQEQLVAQQLQIQLVSTTVNEHCKELHHNSDIFLKNQENLKNSSIVTANELQENIKLQLETYQQNVDKKNAEANQLIQSQAELVEQKMKSMLQELVLNTTRVYEESTIEAKTMAKQVNSKLESGLNSLNATQRMIHELNESHTNATHITADSTLNKLDQEISVVTIQCNTAESVLANVSGMVGVKRKFLDSTVTDLCVNVHDAIKKGIDVVETTSATAQKVLSDVSSASTAMNQTASNAMNSFTNVMDEQGSVLTNTMQTHFGNIDTHCDIQNKDLNNLKLQANNHDANIISTKASSSGNTPKKVLISNQTSPFRKTRNHKIIKQNLKESISNGECAITYEKSSLAIQELFSIASISPSCSLIIDTNDDMMMNFTEENSSSSNNSSDRLSKGSNISSSNSETDCHNNDTEFVTGTVKTIEMEQSEMSSGENANPNINHRVSQSKSSNATSKSVSTANSSSTSRVSKIVKSTTKASSTRSKNVDATLSNTENL